MKPFLLSTQLRTWKDRCLNALHAWLNQNSSPASAVLRIGIFVHDESYQKVEIWSEQGEYWSDLADFNARTPSVPFVVILYIPTESVQFFSVTLPHANLTLLPALLPGLLEEQVAGPIEDLHFALPKDVQPGSTVVVAAVNQQTFARYLQPLRAQSYPVIAAYPDAYRFPAPEQGWALYTTSDRLLLRTADPMTLALTRAQANSWLTALPPPSTIRVTGTVWDLPFAFDHCDADLSLLQQQMLAVAAPLSLLQGTFKTKKSYAAPSQRGLRWGSLALASVFALNLVYLLGAIAWRSHQLARVEAENLKLYQTFFPQATAVVSPRVLIGRQLGHLVAQGPFFKLVNSLNQVVQGQSEIALTVLDYQNEQLSGIIHAPNFAVYESFIQKLRQQGVTVLEKSAQQAAGSIQAEFTLKENPHDS